jgi:hypothetical protein
MLNRPQLTPCITCEKAVVYLWKDKSTNLNGAVNISLNGHYGSEFDNCKFSGIMCDECLDHLVQSKRLTFIRHNPLI